MHETRKSDNQIWTLTVVLVVLFCLTAFLSSCASTQKQRWYEPISVDVGAEVKDGMYPSLGMSYPVGKIYVSTGVWGGTDYSGWYWGPYLSFGYSFEPFRK